MIDYRLYFLNKDGRITRREDFEALNDEDALAHAKQYVDGRAIEVWQRARMVARLEPE